MNRLGHVLVVEDEVAIQALLRFSLEQAGFQVHVAGSAEEAIVAIAEVLPALVLLDLMLPGMSGSTLAKRLRGEARTRDLPIIMVTARAEEIDRLRGLELGADDYVTKPFSTKELVARVRAVLRRNAPEPVGDVIAFGALQLDVQQCTVQFDDKALELAPTDYALLKYLLSHPRRTHTREQLLDVLRGDHRVLDERTVDAYVRRLRTALGTAGWMVETVRGVGYRLVERRT